MRPSSGGDLGLEPGLEGLAVPPRRRRPPAAHAGVAAAVLVAGAASSVLGALAWKRAVQSQTSRSFGSTASAAASALARSLQRDADLAATARTPVQTNPGVSNRRFATWFHLLGTHETCPGSFGLLYVASAPARASRRCASPKRTSTMAGSA